MKSAVPEEDLAKLKISRDSAASGPVVAKNQILTPFSAPRA